MRPDAVLHGGGGRRAVADTRSSCYNLTLAVSWGGVGEGNALSDRLTFEKHGENCSSEDNRVGWLLLTVLVLWKHNEQLRAMTGHGKAGATARGPLDARRKSFYLLEQQDLIV